MSKHPKILPELVTQRILILRGVKVMLDADLADLYGVQTKVLNQAVRRNAERFPEDFMFHLTQEEKNEVVTNCDHLARLKSSPVRVRFKLMWKYLESRELRKPTFCSSTGSAAVHSEALARYNVRVYSVRWVINANQKEICLLTIFRTLLFHPLKKGEVVFGTNYLRMVQRHKRKKYGNRFGIWCKQH